MHSSLLPIPHFKVVYFRPTARWVIFSAPLLGWSARYTMVDIMSAPLVSRGSLLHITYFLSILVGPLEKGMAFLIGHFFFPYFD